MNLSFDAGGAGAFGDRGDRSAFDVAGGDSGDRMGRISRCGDSLLRSYLFEAATVALSRVKRADGPCAWAAALAKRVGVAKRGWRRPA
jgi:transposase